jgi:hypothetical protein
MSRASSTTLGMDEDSKGNCADSGSEVSFDYDFDQEIGDGGADLGAGVNFHDQVKRLYSARVKTAPVQHFSLEGSCMKHDFVFWSGSLRFQGVEAHTCPLLSCAAG